MYHAIYKCRLCGEEFSEGNTGEEIARDTTILLAMRNSTAGALSSTTFTRTKHNCKDGSFGLADFLGFRKVEE